MTYFLFPVCPKMLHVAVMRGASLLLHLGRRATLTVNGTNSERFCYSQKLRSLNFNMFCPPYWLYAEPVAGARMFFLSIRHYSFYWRCLIPDTMSMASSTAAASASGDSSGAAHPQAPSMQLPLLTTHSTYKKLFTANNWNLFVLRLFSSLSLRR